MKLIPSNRCLQQSIDSANTSDSQFFEIKWLSSDEAAAHLRISVKSLLNESSNGKIPHYKLGRRNRYRLDELNELLLVQKRGVIKNGH